MVRAHFTPPYENEYFASTDEEKNVKTPLNANSITIQTYTTPGGFPPPPYSSGSHTYPHILPRDFETLNRLLLLTDIALSIISTLMARPLLEIAKLQLNFNNEQISHPEVLVLLGQRLTPYILSFILIGYLYAQHVCIFSWIDNLNAFVFSVNMAFLMILALAPVAQDAQKYMMVSLDGLRMNMAVFILATLIITAMLAYLFVTRFRHELSASKQDRALFNIFVNTMSYQQFAILAGQILGLGLSGVLGLGALWVPIAVVAALIIPKYIVEFLWRKHWKDAIKNVLRPDGYCKERLNSFGDGVYGVALILTVLDMKGSPHFSDEVPGLISHAVTFVLLCLHWFIFLKSFKDFSGPINNYIYWFNHLHLMIVVLLPFSVEFAIYHYSSPLFFIPWGICWFLLILFQALTYFYIKRVIPRRRLRVLCFVGCILGGLVYIVCLALGINYGIIVSPSWYYQTAFSVSQC
eukprot:TRINITY_DN3596_c0_g1_i1.p1 TRINITY_DN3596_c0_g1~~TRINITY_DN3596_c0_g1_i1.p1  ORF type:complete len:465 (-),score=30.34 TRINITY_DN3596_c0_g1_i1:67-1461(-)